MPAADDLPVLAFASQEEFETWLEDHHATAPGVWIRIAKKATGIPTITPAEAIESCLCFGWIDGQRRAGDEATFLQRYTPRRARSRWSKINRAKAEELIAAGRMRPAGLAEVQRAKDDGRWDAAYDSARTMTVPEDLKRALDADPRAKAEFAALDATNRYAILYRLHDAKRPETRARRLESFVAMLARGERLHPRRQVRERRPDRRAG
jgi:uncharacterized protein YdeI (YjbR/CyaY-like superfamily)